MDQSLSDLKVLDLTHHIAGPYCTKLLADYGADVIKIEKPGVGDATRRLGPFPNDTPHPEKSGLFLHLNTNKRSVTLNLKSSTGKAIFKEMVKDADLVVESYRPDTMASFGLDYLTLKELNPGLVMASISSFGRTGPYRDLKMSELVLSGMTGRLYSTGLPDREPLKYAGRVLQYQGGQLALVGILGALCVREWQGVGQHLDLSLMQMLGSNLDFRADSVVTYQFSGQVWGRVRTGSPAWPPSGIYPCADGYMCWISGAKWRNVAQMLRRPDLLTDPRFATPEARAQHPEEVDEILYPWMMERTMQQCLEAGVAAGLLVAPCNTVEGAFQDPHLQGRGFFTEAEHPAMGKVGLMGRPFIMNETPWQLRRPSPLLGQHTAEVLGGMGYSREDLVRLRGARVI